MSTNKYFLTTLFTLTLFLSAFSFANAAEYYIATDGSDCQSCGTIDKPWATFSHAFGQMSGGDTLFVRGGTYAQDINADDGLPSGTSWEDATTIKNYDGDVWLKPTSYDERGIIYLTGDYSYIIFDGINCNGEFLKTEDTCIWLREGPHHIKFTNSEAKNSKDSVVFISYGTEYIELINVIAHDGGPISGKHNCFYISGKHQLLDRVTGYNCYGSGVSVRSTSTDIIDVTVRNSKFYNTGIGIGIHDRNNDIPPHYKVYNNIVWKSNLDAYGGITVNADNSEVYNNIVYDNSGFGIYADNRKNSVIKNNIIYGNSQNKRDTGSNNDWSDNLTSDPLFTDPDGPDNIPGNADDWMGLTLQSTSLAINTGTSDVGGLFNTDILGAFRPQGDAWDIGAYEYGGTVGPPPTCEDFTYTDWLPTICPSSEIQTKEVATSLPTGCTGGNPETFTQSCEYIPGQGPSITTNKTSYTPNESINVTVTGGNSNVEEWVGLYIASNQDSAWGETWQTLNGTQTDPTSPIPYPVPLTFTAPTTLGTYNMRYFANDGNGTKLAQSPDFTVTNQTTLRGDLDQNGTVNTLDWSIMNANWGTSNSTADINNDGIVNTIDFSIMNGEWGMNN